MRMEVHHTDTYGACQRPEVISIRYGMDVVAHSKDRLGPEDWTKVALAAIAEQGAANVSIERLARELGATKGSFYWHFKDRPALIAAALDRWERDYTCLLYTSPSPRD